MNRFVLGISDNPKLKLSETGDLSLAACLNALSTLALARTHQSLGPVCIIRLFHGDVEDERRLDRVGFRGAGDLDRPAVFPFRLEKGRLKVDLELSVVGDLRTAHPRVVKCPAIALHAVVLLTRVTKSWDDFFSM